MALGKDKGKIIKYGGGLLRVIALTDDTGSTSSGTVKDLGYVDEVSIAYNSETESVQDETGNTVANLPGNTTVKMTGTFLQSDVDLLDFLRDSTVGTFYRVYHKMSAGAAMNGKTQEFFGAIGVIKPMFEVKSKSKKIPFEINFLRNDSAIAMTTTQAPMTLFGATDVAAQTGTIAANKYFVILESTSVG